jgi:hypothetical protein
VGIESDQLVFDYLSRIGDLAHRTSMTAAERARLVSGLRGRIDKLRAEEGGAESKAAVRKILTRLGKPEEIVAGGGGSAGTATAGAGPGVPSPRSGAEDDRFGEDTRISLWKRATTGGTPGSTPSAPRATASAGASAPHLAGMDELGPEESDPDWWRVDPSPYGGGSGGSRTFGEPVPGFVGGIELPELFNPPQDEAEPDSKPGQAKPGEVKPRPGVPAPRAGEGIEVVADDDLGRRRLWPGRRPFAAGARLARGPRAGGLVEWVAALLLVAGAVAGSLIPLAVGWLAAWWSPRLSRTEAKWAAAGMPGLVASGTIVWLWGRVDGRWGDPIAQGGDALGQALTEAGPVLLRVAAVASALFLIWRARRPRGGGEPG